MAGSGTGPFPNPICPSLTTWHWFKPVSVSCGCGTESQEEAGSLQVGRSSGVQARGYELHTPKIHESFFLNPNTPCTWQGIQSVGHNLALFQAALARIFQPSTFTPVPKRSDTSKPNDFRRVALVPGEPGSPTQQPQPPPGCLPSRPKWKTWCATLCNTWIAAARVLGCFSWIAGERAHPQHRQDRVTNNVQEESSSSAASRHRRDGGLGLQELVSQHYCTEQSPAEAVLHQAAQESWTQLSRCRPGLQRTDRASTPQVERITGTTHAPVDSMSRQHCRNRAQSRQHHYLFYEIVLFMSLSLIYLYLFM